MVKQILNGNKKDIKSKINVSLLISHPNLNPSSYSQIFTVL